MPVGITEDWKLIKKGQPVKYVLQGDPDDEASEDVVFDAFVAAIDPEIGITLEYVDQEFALENGCIPREDGIARPVCINKRLYVESVIRYTHIFNDTVKEILTGTVMSGFEGGISLSSCAFV